MTSSTGDGAPLDTAIAPNADNSDQTEIQRINQIHAAAMSALSSVSFFKMLADSSLGWWQEDGKPVEQIRENNAIQECTDRMKPFLNMWETPENSHARTRFIQSRTSLAKQTAPGKSLLVSMVRKSEADQDDSEVNLNSESPLFGIAEASVHGFVASFCCRLFLDIHIGAAARGIFEAWFIDRGKLLHLSDANIGPRLELEHAEAVRLVESQSNRPTKPVTEYVPGGIAFHDESHDPPECFYTEESFIGFQKFLAKFFCQYSKDQRPDLALKRKLKISPRLWGRKSGRSVEIFCRTKDDYERLKERYPALTNVR